MIRQNKGKVCTARPKKIKFRCVRVRKHKTATFFFVSLPITPPHTFISALVPMEYRRLVNEAHLIVQEFLQSNGYTNAAAAFEQDALSILEDIPKSTPAPKPLIEVLTDIRMNQLHSQLSQLNMPR